MSNNGITSTNTELPIPYGRILLTLLITAAIPLGSTSFFNIVTKLPLYSRIAWVAAFVINVLCVSLPGRFDGETKDGEVKIAWETVLAPAPYAFAIWGLIYAGELAISIFTGVSGSFAGKIQKAVIFWTLGNLFQSLWCFSFRPALKRALWLPTSHLALAAVSYLYLLMEITEQAFSIPSTDIWGRVSMLVFRVPISLHTGWLTAATLLNLNGWAAVSKISMGKQIALATASGYFAFIAAIFLSIKLKDPLLALTVAWALSAIAVATKRNKELAISEDSREALTSMENSLANILIGTAAAIPVVFLKMF